MSIWSILKEHGYIGLHFHQFVPYGKVRQGLFGGQYDFLDCSVNEGVGHVFLMFCTTLPIHYRLLCSAPGAFHCIGK